MVWAVWQEGGAFERARAGAQQGQAGDPCSRQQQSAAVSGGPGRRHPRLGRGYILHHDHTHPPRHAARAAPARPQRYVYRRRADGIYVFNLGKTWEKLQLAARIIVAIENPQVRSKCRGREMGGCVCVRMCVRVVVAGPCKCGERGLQFKEESSRWRPCGCGLISQAECGLRIAGARGRDVRGEWAWETLAGQALARRGGERRPGSTQAGEGLRKAGGRAGW